jgi:hypothetical protein
MTEPLNRQDYKSKSGHYNTQSEIEDGRWFVGEAGVDSGLLIIIDPCYISKLPIARREPNPKHPSGYYDSTAQKEWGEFCRLVGKNNHKPMSYGGGMVVSTGSGDGGFPVFSTYRDHTEVKHEVLTGHWTNERDYDKSIGSHTSNKIYNYKEKRFVELTSDLRWRLNEYQREDKKIGY